MLVLLAYIIYASGFDSILYPIVKPTWVYRIIQKELEALGLLIVFLVSGIDWAVACLLPHYFMTMDYLFYVFRNEFKSLREEYEQKNKVPFWLNRIYFSGKWVFQYSFTVEKFALSALTGIVLGGLVGYFHIVSFIYNFIKDLL